MHLKVYGCRGSSPLSNTAPSVFGGNTSCFKLESGSRTLILDAGTGLLAMEVLQKPINILLSHLHMDHIIGLASYPPIWEKNKGVRIFTLDRGGKDIKQQVLGAFKPPYWPMPLEKVSGSEITAVKDGVTFFPDEIFSVTPFIANHPDKTIAFKITDGEKFLMYMLDYEIGTLPGPAYELLVRQCGSADIIICDATYHPDDYPQKRGWGHSTVTDGIRLAKDSGCGKILFTHFSFDYSDESLNKWPKLLSGIEDRDRFIFARDGMEITI